MTYVEPQHNVAGPVTAVRGAWMTDEEKEAGTRSGDAPTDPASRLRADDADGAAAKRRAPLSEHARTRIATQLRAMYDSVAQQPVPDRFADLIARLDAAERKGP